MDEPTKPEPAAPDAASEEARRKRRRGMMTTAVAIGAALLEPELLPGIAIGLAAVAAPKLMPRIASRLRPLGEAMRRLSEHALARGRELTRMTKERVAHVAGRVDRTNESHQPA